VTPTNDEIEAMAKRLDRNADLGCDDRLYEAAAMLRLWIEERNKKSDNDEKMRKRIESRIASSRMGY